MTTRPAPRTEAQILALGYRKPVFEYITAKSAPGLYDLERDAQDAVEAVAREMCAVLGFRSEQLFTHGYPQAMADLLNAIDSQSSTLASIAYLESKGFTVLPPAEDDDTA
jgi:hypothetical protein